MIVAVLIACIAGAWAFLDQPYAGFQNETFVTIEHGTGTLDIGRALAQAGVIRYPWQLWMERAMHPGSKLQAGEYRFQDAATPAEVFSRIARGDIFFFEVTVPEGSNMFDIAHILENAGAMAPEDFLKTAYDPSAIRDLDPNARSLEGYLFPSTYRLTHSTTPAEFCRQMTAQFRRHWKQLAGQADVHQAVTLASLVEKETGVASERPLIAGVFENRLKKNMLLQCDPTTIYAALLENRYRDAIHKSDLASRNEYNTYQHPGLPPGPIANPGADSIAAALHPAETNFLYFVAKPEGGGHNFSTDLASHEKATKAYRKKARKAG
ncbi:MAG: endolytic transglycosylase MltG [Acidobacteriia bacterium]|nr:endolytic transglycosylase MltG [Terriglobia bacterium]